MPSEKATSGTQFPVWVYARLLIDLHRLIVEGKGDGEEAETLTDRMDAPWHAMTSKEQARMRGLAADLNSLRDGDSRQVDMAPHELEKWQQAAEEAFRQSEAGDVDTTLEFLRQPAPTGLPCGVIPFLQARCWEKLGDLETSLVFVKEAERLVSAPFARLVQQGIVQRLAQIGAHF